MKNRDYKIFVPNNYYHIFNRGVGKMNIFCDGQDYLNFLKRFNLALGLTRMTLAGKRGLSLRINPLPKDSFSIICYCLMPNHFHLLIRQNSTISISKLIAKVGTSYSMYFNRKYSHTGGVFQDQYKAIPVESDPQFLWLSAYIHNNPKTARLVTELDGWQWSSYLDFVGKRQGKLCDKSAVLEQFKTIDDYAVFVKESCMKIKERKDLQKLLLD